MDSQHNPEYNHNDEEKPKPDKSDQHSSAKVEGSSNFRDNRNVSSGSGSIHDYGGVQGGVHNYYEGSTASVSALRHDNEQTFRYVWQVVQESDKLNYNPVLNLKSQDLAIVFPGRTPITQQVCDHLDDKLNLRADIVVITNTTDPNKSETPTLRADKDNRPEWGDIISSFADLLKHISSKQRNVHIFFSSPAALACAVGMKIGYNYSHTFRIYHLDGDNTKEYHWVYEK